MQISYHTAEVTGIIAERPGCVEVAVAFDGGEAKAIYYPAITGEISVGDRVVINTTAVELELGTGGYHYIALNLDRIEQCATGAGHIMKLRYTPLQMKCLSVEEEASPHYHKLRAANSILKMPVVVGTLHSQLPAAAVMIRERFENARIAYIMTDGAALPMAFSRLVNELKQKGIVDAAITVGNAFGGDYEAINIYSGLVAARHVAEADVAIVTMGPGIVGSATKLGFTGIEQGQILNAVHSLGGVPIAIPRISFKDERARHFGLSHHTVTALTVAALVRATVTIPALEEEQAYRIDDALRTSGITASHDIVSIDARETITALTQRDIHPTTMGRKVDEDPAFFMAAGAAGLYAASVIRDI